MKSSLILLVLLIIISLSFAQNSKSEQTKSPDIIFEATTIDFGTIEEGDNPMIIYKFYNSGNAPLILKSVNPGCGCTASKWPKQPIMPGESAEIEASFRSVGFGGRNVQKNISVITNVSENGKDKVIQLLFKGFVNKKTQSE